MPMKPLDCPISSSGPVPEYDPPMLFAEPSTKT